MESIEMESCEITSNEIKGLFELTAEAELKNKPFAIVTLIGVQGRVPRRDGRMAVFLDGTSSGTIGGGEAEREAIQMAIECIHKDKGGKKMINVKESGKAEIFIDVPIARRKAIIVGTGHVAIALANEFHNLMFEVLFVDDRDVDVPKWASLVKKTELINSLEHYIDDKTAVLFSNPEDVDSMIEVLLQTKTPYVGVLSSRKRKTFFDSRVRMPMGLEIGAQTPEEISVAVTAEVMSVFYKKVAQPASLWKNRLVVIRGAGDLATAVGIRLHKAGFSVVHLEVEKPTVIRSTVSFAQAIFDKTTTVEGVTARYCDKTEVLHVLDEGEVPVIADSNCSILELLSPIALVDAIIAKKNLGTNRGMAPLTIALGPGFEAGKDVDAVIETQRGHRLGVIIKNGCAAPNTGIPGIVGGYGKERVMHSPSKGVFKPVAAIGDIVEANQIIAYVEDFSGENKVPVITTIAGKVRGMLHEGLVVPEGFKVADVDPRGESTDHLTCSDKARAISGSVLEAIMSFLANRF